MPQTSTEPAGRLSSRAIAMPADTNPSGDIFGGWLMAQMDLAGSAHARWRAKGRVATVAVDSMTFHKPVNVGDEVSCFTRVSRVGTTSITVHIEAWKRREGSDEYVKVTVGCFTYVALNEDGSKRPVPTGGEADEAVC